jgi:prefoldin subunit 5
MKRFLSINEFPAMEGAAMNERLVELRKELEKGQQQMALLDQRRQELRDTILRISGAIQVLEELQAKPAQVERERQMVSEAA